MVKFVLIYLLCVYNLIGLTYTLTAQSNEEGLKTLWSTGLSTRRTAMTVRLVDNANGKHLRLPKEHAAYISCLLIQLGIDHSLLHFGKTNKYHTRDIRESLRDALVSNRIVNQIDGATGQTIPVVMLPGEVASMKLPRLDIPSKQIINNYLQFVETCEEGYKI